MRSDTDVLGAIPDELVESCLANECVLFAGAGLSARAGLSTWNQFLVDLLQFAQKENRVDRSYAESLLAALFEGARNEAADAVVQSFEGQRELLQSFLKSYTAEVPDLAHAHRCLQLIPFAAVLTPNYDPLLEKTLPEYAGETLYVPQDSHALLDCLAQKRRFLLKLYGVVDRLDTLIFAPFEYRQLLASNVAFLRFVEGLFSSRNFLFVGLSIEGIQDFLSGFVFHGASPRKHFALAAVEGSAWKAKAELLRRRHNIHVIPVPYSETIPEVDEFLDNLVARVASVKPLESPTRVTPGLRRIVLEEIGVYDRLELNFEENWKVLLGDNGVGKSTILKAIAVAFLGSDARRFAGRLVRAGRTKGRITLYTEHNKSGYVTEILTKDVSSEADVTSLPSRPMEAEGWLALGFSPLRVVSWAAPSGPQTMIEKGRPTADDLLPLISGDADPRMDRLKQWIVNLDALNKPGPIRTIQGHQDTVRSVVFAPDGRTLISGSIDRSIRFWDAWTGAETRRIEAHESGVNCVAISRDGRVVVSGSHDCVAKTWNTATGEHIRSLRGSKSQIFAVALPFEGPETITASESGAIRVWTLSKQERVHLIHPGGSVWCVALSPDGSTIACGSYAGTINLMRYDTGALIRTITVGRGAVMGLAWMPDGRSVVCGSRNGPVNVCDVESGATTRELPGADTLSVAVSNDGMLIAAGFANGEMRVWNAQSGDVVLSAQAHGKAVWSIAFSPDGRTLASASEDRTIRVWTVPGLTEGNPHETIRSFFRLINELTDRPDIEYLRVTDDFRVLIRTAQAPEGVPLELLSQGMTSLFSWVGVLCQRLKETLQISTNEPIPTNSYALVMIDELDAHMHPRWQRVLIHMLKRLFPNVQFIASTHSPLIVGGLKKEEVERFAFEDGKVVKAEFEADMTLGRTDQVLTGDLFGLDTTLDPLTQEKAERYEVLLGKRRRNTEEEREFRALEEELEDRIPPSRPGLVERRAVELLEALREADGELLKAELGTEEDPVGLPVAVRERMMKLTKALGGEA